MAKSAAAAPLVNGPSVSCSVSRLPAEQILKLRSALTRRSLEELLKRQSSRGGKRFGRSHVDIGPHADAFPVGFRNRIHGRSTRQEEREMIVDRYEVAGI